MSEVTLGSVRKGVLLTLALHVLQFIIAPIVFVVSGLLLPASANQYAIASLMLALGGYGITQLIYMVPAVLKFKKRGEQHTVQGLILGAGITFLVCAACDGSFLLPGLVR